MILYGAFLVGCGSAFGSVGRYAIGQAMSKVYKGEFPWGTWIVNMVGTLLLGLFFQAFVVIHRDPEWWLLFGTGFCGAFTTFSTMSFEVIELLKKRVWLGLVYLSSSLALGLLLAWMTQL
jgi:fluoride exporter